MNKLEREAIIAKAKSKLDVIMALGDRIWAMGIDRNITLISADCGLEIRGCARYASMLLDSAENAFRQPDLRYRLMARSLVANILDRLDDALSMAYIITRDSLSETAKPDTAKCIEALYEVIALVEQIK